MRQGVHPTIDITYLEDNSNVYGPTHDEKLRWGLEKSCCHGNPYSRLIRIIIIGCEKFSYTDCQ